MSIDLLGLQKGIGDIISARVGTQLSQIGGKPSIVRARSANAKLKYPYATMDVIGISDPVGDVTNVSQDDNGFPVYETHTDIVYQISIRGEDNISYNLTKQVQRAFSFPNVLETLHTDHEATVTTVSGITPIPDVLSTKQQEFNIFNVTLRVNDKETIEEVGYITAIKATGTINSDTGTVTEADVEAEFVALWSEGVYNYSGTWMFSDVWGVE